MSESSPKNTIKNESKKPGIFDQIIGHIAETINEEGRVIDGIFLGKDAASKEKPWIPHNNQATHTVKEGGSVSKKEKKEERERKNTQELVAKLNTIGYDEKLKNHIEHVITKKEEELSTLKVEFDIAKDEYESLEKEIAYAKIEFYNSDRDDRKEKEDALEELQQKFAPVEASYTEMKRAIRKLEKGSSSEFTVGGSQEDIIDSMSIPELKKLVIQTKLAQATEYFFNIANSKFNIPEENISRNKLGAIESFRLGYSPDEMLFEKEMKKALDAYLADSASKN